MTGPEDRLTEMCSYEDKVYRNLFSDVQAKMTLPDQVNSNVHALKELSKRLRQLQRKEMTRKERSDLYGDMLQLIDQVYKRAFQDPEQPESAKWYVLAHRIPKRGSLETGGNNMLAANLWRGVNVLYRDPRGRKNALMLVVRLAKLSSALYVNYAPFLREMATALGFPLYVKEGATGAIGDVIDVTDDDGIRVGPLEFNGHNRVHAAVMSVPK